MASGKLGTPANLVAGIDTLIYTVPASKTATVNVRFTNRNATAVKVRLAIGTGVAPVAADYIDYDVTLILILEDTGLMLSAGEQIWAWSDTANVSVRAHGMEG